MPDIHFTFDSSCFFNQPSILNTAREDHDDGEGLRVVVEVGGVMAALTSVKSGRAVQSMGLLWRSYQCLG